MSVLEIIRALRAGLDELEQQTLLKDGLPPELAGGTDVPAWARLKTAADLQAQARPDPPVSPTAQPQQVEIVPRPADNPRCPKCQEQLVLMGRKQFCLRCQEQR